MEARSLRFIATACTGELLSGLPEACAQRACTDSRRVQAGDLFFALPGGRFDGHDFLRQAAEKGAIAVVVQRSRVTKDWSGCAMIAVEDTRKALGQLASTYREDFSLPLVAVGVAGAGAGLALSVAPAGVLMSIRLTVSKRILFWRYISKPPPSGCFWT